MRDLCPLLQPDGTAGAGGSQSGRLRSLQTAGAEREKGPADRTGGGRRGACGRETVFRDWRSLILRRIAPGPSGSICGRKNFTPAGRAEGIHKCIEFHHSDAACILETGLFYGRLLLRDTIQRTRCGHVSCRRKSTGRNFFVPGSAC